MCRSAQSNTREVHEIELPEVTVLYTEYPDRPPSITSTVTISTAADQAFVVNLVVDTGSSVSILPYSTYACHFSNVALSQPTARLVTYAKVQIPVVGCLSANVSLHDYTVPATFFIVEKGTPLMGRDLMSALHVRIENNQVLPSNALSDLAPPVPVLQCTVADLTEFGCAKDFVHRVKLDETVTHVRQKLHRLPLSVHSAVSEELNRLQAAGVIEHIDASAWVSPIVVTQKKSGKIRMCVDLRGPNKAVIVDSFPLPHMDELLAALKGSAVFTTIDLTNAYYQVPLHEDSRDLTAFITHDGLYRFCRVPYGLASAPAAFQKMMTIILAGLSGVENYLDDIIIHGRDMASHDKTLQAVLQHLEVAGLQLNKDKCHFRQTSLLFLGHTVSAEGLCPDGIERTCSLCFPHAVGCRA